MSKSWNIAGKVAFWLSWPLLYGVLRISKRTRVIVISGGEVLLVKGWLGTGAWQLPGGGLHFGEDPVLGAVREVSEETALELDHTKLKPLGLKSAKSKEGFRYKYYGFILELPNKPEVKMQPKELVDIGWFKLGQLNEMNLSNSTRELLAASNILK